MIQICFGNICCYYFFVVLQLWIWYDFSYDFDIGQDRNFVVGQKWCCFERCWIVSLLYIHWSLVPIFCQMRIVFRYSACSPSIVNDDQWCLHILLPMTGKHQYPHTIRKMLDNIPAYYSGLYRLQPQPDAFPSAGSSGIRECGGSGIARPATLGGWRVVLVADQMLIPCPFLP